MEKIVKQNGYVYLVKDHDEAGRFQTFYNLGKDPDDPMWKEDKPKKTKKEDEN